MPGAIAAATVWASGGLLGSRLFWDAIRPLEPEAAPPPKRPMTDEGELHAAFEGAGFTGVAATKLTLRMEYANFDDFWCPAAYGQGTFGRFFNALPEARRDQLRNAVHVACY